MNVSLFALPRHEVHGGFEQVLSRWRALEDDESDDLCDLGEDANVVERLLERAGAGEGALSAVSGETVLGDDGVGTVCTVLSPQEVVGVADFIASVDVDEVMRNAPDVLSGIIRGGIPVGYLEDLHETLDALWRLYGSAARDGLCVAQVFEG